MSLNKVKRFDVESIHINQITRVLSTGSLDSLPEPEQEYYSMMELVRGLRAKMVHNNKVVTKAGIIRLLKSDAYGLSDWHARQVYADSLNFFYAQDNVRPEAYANLYADRLEKWADAAFINGREKEAGSLLEKAAKLRGCFDKQETEIPDELLNTKSITVYTANRSDVGVEEIDRADLNQFIDSIPDIPVIVRDRLKEDSGINKFNIVKRMTQDINEFSEEDNQKA